MSKQKRLIKDTIIYAIGNFGNKFLSFFMLPIYTAYFTTLEYGKWDLVTTTVTMFIPFITFELVSASYRWLLGENDKDKKQAIFTTSFLAILKNIIIFNIIALIIGYFINIEYLIFIIILINSNIMLSFCQQISRGLGKNKLFVISGLLNTILIFSINMYLMFIVGLRIESFFIANILSNFIVSIIIWKTSKLNKLFKRNEKSKELYSEFIKYSFPLIPSAISWWVMNVSDRYIIKVFLGAEYNGVYAIANKIPSLLIMFSSIFFMAWKDNVIRESDSNDKNIYYSKIFSIYSKFMFGGLIVLIAMSQIILTILVSNSFISAWKYSIILLIATLFNVFSQFWGTGYHASKQTKSILNTTIVGAIVNIVFNLLFINKLGLYAASISTLLAYLVMWILRIRDKNKNFEIIINKKNIIFLFIILSIITLLSYVKDSIINILIIIISIILCVIINREFIFKVLNIIKIKFNNKNLISR